MIRCNVIFSTFQHFYMQYFNISKTYCQFSMGFHHYSRHFKGFDFKFVALFYEVYFYHIDN